MVPTHLAHVNLDALDLLREQEKRGPGGPLFDKALREI